MDEARIIVRPFETDLDQAFIYATWRNSMYYGSREYKAREPKEAFKELTQEIRDILRHAKVRIACLEDAPTVIIGYCVFTDAHLDWVYVKEDFRQRGVGTLLVPKDIRTYTEMRTKIGNAILEKKQGEENGQDERNELNN